MDVKKIIKKSALIVMNSYQLGKKSFIPFERRLGKESFTVLNQLRQSQWWSKEQIQQYQWTKLKSVINYAYENVPYYKKVFYDIGVNPQEIKSFKEFVKLPFLTREDIRNNKNDLRSQKYKKSELIKIHTSGTTGSPVEFYEDKFTRIKENAFFCRYWDWHGYRWGDKCAVLRGNNKTQKHRYNYYDNYLEIACTKLDDESIRVFLEELEKYCPQYMQSYPSIAYLVAKYINENQLNNKFRFIKTVFCASEKLFSHQKGEIREAFACRIVEHYGHCEKAVLVQQCEKEGLHIIPEYGYTELIDANGHTIDEPGMAGEIVGTGFNNYAFPFIRYRTGDIATLEKGKCDCGRNFSKMGEIQGRYGDYITTPLGIKISATVIEFAFDSIAHVKEWQIIQRRKDLIEIMIVKDRHYDQKSESILLSALKNIIKENIQMNIKYVNNINRPENMKHRLVISDLEG